MPKMPEGEKKEESAESLAEKKEQVGLVSGLLLHIVLALLIIFYGYGNIQLTWLVEMTSLTLSFTLNFTM